MSLDIGVGESSRFRSGRKELTLNLKDVLIIKGTRNCSFLTNKREGLCDSLNLRPDRKRIEDLRSRSTKVRMGSRYHARVE